MTTELETAGRILDSAARVTVHADGSRLVDLPWSTIPEAVAIQQSLGCFGRGADDGWFGGTVESFLRQYRDGDRENAQKADELAAKVADAVTLQTPKAVTTDSVVGASPSIGRYLSGHPCCMRRRVPAPGLGPLDIVVDSFVSSVCDPETMVKRGQAVAALAFALSSIRPVRLFVAKGGDHKRSRFGHFVSRVEIPTRPLDRSLVAFALCHVGMSRRTTVGFFAAAFGDGDTHGLGRERAQQCHDRFQGWSTALRPNRIAEICSLSGRDTVVLPALHGSVADDIDRDPVAWLKANLRPAGNEPVDLW